MIDFLRSWWGRDRQPDYKAALERVRSWIAANSTEEGVCHSSRSREVYREVTGYFIPSLLGLGEMERARRWGQHLLSTLSPAGAVTSLDGQPYVFDTAQVMRGFLCWPREEAYREGLARCAEYLLKVQKPDGSFPDPYAGKIPAYIFLYCIEPWRQAGELLGRPEFEAAAARALDFYATRFDPNDFSAHSHFFGYAAEALIDNGRPELARAALETARREIRRDGALNAAQGVRWVCGPGQAQFAICYYKQGDLATGDRLLHWMIRHQSEGGGFLGAYGKGSHYFPDAEPSWAVKFFIDAVLWRIRKHFDLEFPQYMDRKERENDFRMQGLEKAFDGLERARVLEIGCGNGRFLSLLRKRWPDHAYHGIDLSATLVAQLPEWAHGRQGDMMALPYGDGEFDAVFLIESLEHAPDWRGALAEAVRVLRPGGRFAVIDKNSQRLGALKIMPWERWFDVEAVAAHLRTQAADVQVTYLNLPGDTAAPPLFAMWSGRRA